MRVSVTGASGLIGKPLVAALRSRGDQVLTLGRSSGDVRWDPLSEPIPLDALEGSDAIIHLAGEPVAQRWTAAARQKIEQSRAVGTANVVAGLGAAGVPPPRVQRPRTQRPGTQRPGAPRRGARRPEAQRPRVLLCASAVGFYGDRGDERLTEESAPGEDWLARVCVEWERAAAQAGELGLRVCMLRTGVVLSPSGGALAKMLPAFKLGLGGPVAGGRQYIPWIALEDLVGIYLAALDDDRWHGPANATAPGPVTNAQFSKALGRALHRPALAPVPGLAVRALFGSMAQIVTGSQNAVPARPQQLGYQFRYPELEPALAATLS